MHWRNWQFFLKDNDRIMYMNCTQSRPNLFSGNPRAVIPMMHVISQLSNDMKEVLLRIISTAKLLPIASVKVFYKVYAVSL